MFGQFSSVSAIMDAMRRVGFVPKRSTGGIVIIGEGEAPQTIVEVYPTRNWERYTERHDDWVEISNDGAEYFERIMADAGFSLGSVGGHPPNIDYTSEDGSVMFFYVGNPYHL